MQVLYVFRLINQHNFMKYYLFRIIVSQLESDQITIRSCLPPKPRLSSSLCEPNAVS